MGTKGANPRFVVTNLEGDGQQLYDDLYCASGEMENRIKEQRDHWGIENRLHWVLDVVFHDDLARLRSGYGPENMAVVKHMASNLLRKARNKHSMKVRRKLANLNTQYLETILRQNHALN